MRFLTRATFPPTLVEMQMPESRAIVSKHSELHKLLGPRAFDVVITERDEVRFVFLFGQCPVLCRPVCALVACCRAAVLVWIKFLDA